MHLFQSLENIQEPIITGFLSQVPSTFVQAYDGLVDKIMADEEGLGSPHKESKFNMPSNPASPEVRYMVDKYVFSNRQLMVLPISKFHRDADTLTSSVESSINNLKSPSTRILVSTHQPNLFAYSGVFKKIVLLQTLKDLLLESASDSYRFKVINLFLVIDHDFADENWIRVAQLPNIRNTEGIMQLRLPIDKTMRWQMARSIPLPNRNILEHWRAQLFSWIRKSTLFQHGYSSEMLLCNTAKRQVNLRSVKSALISNLESFWDLVEESYSTASTYSDFNAFIMSKIINRLWEYDTLFVRLTDLTKAFERGYGNLLKNHEIYSNILRDMEQLFLKRGVSSGVSSSSYLFGPLWLHCKCGSKAATKIRENEIQPDRTTLVLGGTCMGCKKRLTAKLSIGKTGEIDGKDTQMVYDLSPRSIPIVLLLSSELGISCYASGTDGMRYILFGNRLFNHFSPNNTPKFLVWPARDAYYGFGQCEALESVHVKNLEKLSQLLDHLRDMEAGYRSQILPVLAERERRSKKGSIENDEILSSLIVLKKRQRNTRSEYKLARKVEKAVGLRPCIIDYAINFGLKNTEYQWRQNLFYNQNLNSPCIIDESKLEVGEKN